jgi:PPE-repeat protein
MIKQTLQNAITNIENQKNSAIQQARNKAITEKVNPYNAEIDTAYQKAVSELALKFENQKKELLEAGNKKKLQNEESAINEYVNAVTYRFDLAIAKLKKQIEEMGE